MKDRFKFTAESGVLEIFIYGRIGGSWWDDNAVSAASLAKLLQDHASVSTIKLRVNSLGGSVFEGAAIYNLLRRHNARKEVDIDGVAASAASWIVMAGDVRRIGVLGMFMIHEASGDTWGPAAEHEKTADLLRKMNAQQIDVYATRSKLSRADITKKLEAETWFSAAEALTAGFVTETVADTLADEEAAARRVALGGSIADHGFKNAPSAQLERFFSFAAESRRPRTPLELLGELASVHAPAPPANTDLSLSSLAALPLELR
jgi:ATP-dependent protease ClpP protease subunit